MIEIEYSDASLISRTGSSHAPSLFSKLTRFTHLTHLWVGRVIRAFWERKGSETTEKTKKREREERTIYHTREYRDELF